VPHRSIPARLLVDPEELVLARIDPGSTPAAGSRRKAEAMMARRQLRLEELQARLYAERRRSVLVVLQGIDTSGKDGTITHVIGAVNPQGVAITGFKAPTEQELRHDFLWRIRRRLPAAGFIGIFNRSHYEDVLVARVRGLAPPEEIERRYASINRFEAGLARAGTTVVKLFLHISKEEQRRRLLARLEDPTKHWKFNPADLDDRDRWDEYQAAYEIALRRCSTLEAPWYAVPADHKWYRNVAVTDILVEVLGRLDPRYPEPDLDVAALRARLGAG
jgi:PPK2 family polyphosphate:nucleotide phosphotransferase